MSAAGDDTRSINASFAAYVRHGWKLCAIGRGRKAPTYKRWNSPEKAAEIGSVADDLDGAGLLHAQSGTCALDIDALDKARPWFAERGVDIDALFADQQSVQISFGRPNRAKLLYRMRRPLRTVKPKGSGMELRCATADGESVQDVLPPTQHPDTKRPYEWKYAEPLIAHWSNLPPIPSSLLALWRSLTAGEPDARPVASKPQDAPIDFVRRAIYQYISTRGKEVSNYEDWLEIGMRMHKQTQGSMEALDI